MKLFSLLLAKQVDARNPSNQTKTRKHPLVMTSVPAVTSETGSEKKGRPVLFLLAQESALSLLQGRKPSHFKSNSSSSSGGRRGPLPRHPGRHLLAGTCRGRLTLLPQNCCLQKSRVGEEGPGMSPVLWHHYLGHYSESSIDSKEGTELEEGTTSSERMKQPISFNAAHSFFVS